MSINRISPERLDLDGRARQALWGIVDTEQPFDEMIMELRSLLGLKALPNIPVMAEKVNEPGRPEEGQHHFARAALKLTIRHASEGAMDFEKECPDDEIIQGLRSVVHTIIARN